MRSAFTLGIPALGIHHLEGHLLSPLLARNPPRFPFVALLVSGGHTQLMRVAGVGEYELLGETVDDAAGEAFDKTAQLLGLGYPGGPALGAVGGAGQGGQVQTAAAHARANAQIGQSGFFLQRPEDRSAAAGTQGNARRRGEGRCRGVVPGSDRRRAGREIAVCAGADRPRPARGRRRRRRQPAPARAAGSRVRRARLFGVLSRIRILHRQRRDDRLGRRPASGRRASNNPAGALRLGAEGGSRDSAESGYAFTVKPRWELSASV